VGERARERVQASGIESERQTDTERKTERERERESARERNRKRESACVGEKARESKGKFVCVLKFTCMRKNTP